MAQNCRGYKKSKLSNVIIKPLTVTPGTSLLRIREILLEHKIKRVIVLDQKKPTGVITEKDIARKIYELGTKPIKSVKAKDFTSKTLFALTPDDSIEECAQLMKKHRINLVIILNKNKTLRGIVTKTNLVTVFLTKNVMPIKVSKIMTRKLITVAPSDPILHVEGLMMKYGISRIIVKRDSLPVGVITFRDFVPAKVPKWIAESADPLEVKEYQFHKGLREHHPNHLSHLFAFNAADIMATNPITIQADEDVRLAITRMIKYDISGLPVVKKSRLVGIITKSDIVNTLA